MFPINNNFNNSSFAKLPYLQRPHFARKCSGNECNPPAGSSNQGGFHAGGRTCTHLNINWNTLKRENRTNVPYYIKLKEAANWQSTAEYP